MIDLGVHDDALTFEGALDLKVTPTGVTPRRCSASSTRFVTVITTCRSLGDGHLYYLDGRELLADDDRAGPPDDLHPNAQGYRRMGERSEQRAFGADSPFAD